MTVLAVADDRTVTMSGEELSALFGALNGLRKGDASVQLPLHWSGLSGKVAEVTAITAACDVLFGTDATVEVVYGQSGSIDGTSKAVTVHANSGRHIPIGTTRRWLIPIPSKGHAHGRGSVRQRQASDLGRFG